VILVEPEEPEPMVREDEVKEQVQPEGQVGTVRLKVSLPQDESLFVTFTV